MDPLEKDNTGDHFRKTEKLNPVDFSSSPEHDPETQKIRNRIHGLLDVFEARKFATKKTIEQYRQGAENDSDPENLKKYCKWIEESLGMAKGALDEVQGKLEQGVRSQILSSSDHNSLLEKLMAKGDFVGKMREGKIMQSVEEELGQFQRDRETYDRIQTDPRFYNGGIQQKGKEAIAVPDLRAFLEMPLKARRAFLEKVRKALGKPIVGKKKSSPEVAKMRKGVQAQLEAAHKEGIIGLPILRRLLAQWNKAEFSQKKKEAESIGQALMPYRQWWAEVRNTLDAPAFRKMIKAREALDWPELKKEFEKIRSQEEMLVGQDYKRRLDRLGRERILNSRMRDEFEVSFSKESLMGKRRKCSELERVVEPHQNLRRQINSIQDRNGRDQVDKIFNDPSSGLEEVKAALDRVAKQKGEGKGVVRDRETIQVKILSEIKNARVRQSIENAQRESTHEEKRTLLGRLKYYISGRRAEDFKTFQQNIAEARVKQGVANAEQKAPLDPARKGAMEKVEDGRGSKVGGPSAEKVVRQEIKSSDPKGGVRATTINAKGTFVATELSHGAGKEKKARIVNVILGDKTGRKGFNELQGVNSETDKISFSTGKTKEDRELNWREMKVLEKSLAADLEKPNSGQDSGRDSG